MQRSRTGSRRLWLALGLMSIAMACLAGSGPAQAQSVGVSSRPDGEWTTLMAEDFEGAFPAPGWESLADDPEYGWGKRECRANGGAYSAWAHGGGPAGSFLDCGTDYPANMNNWLVYGPFSLANADAAEMQLSWWLESETDYDTLSMLVSIDGNTFTGWKVSGSASGWQDFTIDFAAVPELGSVLGAPDVWVAFVFVSDDSVGWEGAYIDDVMLRADIGRQVPPTQGPGPTRVPPTSAPPPTRRPPAEGRTAFLPWVGNAPRPKSIVKPVTSAESGLLKTEAGHQLYVPPGAVPKTIDGADATVQFSIESGLRAEQLPASLPRGGRLVSDAAKFGPDGFQFVLPVDVGMPVPAARVTRPLSLVRYDPGRGLWRPYPYAFGATGDAALLSASAHDLGYAAVLQPTSGAATASGSSAAPQQANCPSCSGAIRFTGHRGDNRCPWRENGRDVPCGYYLTVSSFTAKYPGSGVGNCADPYSPCIFTDPPTILHTGSAPDGTPLDETLFFTSQGTYQFCITASRWQIPGSFLVVPGKRTYSHLVTVTLNKPAWNDSPFYNWHGVTTFDWPTVWDESQWQEPPAACPGLVSSSPTVPVGTGQFQATLTWTNTDTRSADVDLHLYGPNGMHVFYDDPVSADGSVRLDVDNREHNMGTVMENIFSTKAMPPGNYELVVELYGQGAGSGMDFNVRTIHSGSVQTFTRHLASPGEKTSIERFGVR